MVGVLIGVRWFFRLAVGAPVEPLRMDRFDRHAAFAAIGVHGRLRQMARQRSLGLTGKKNWQRNF